MKNPKTFNQRMLGPWPRRLFSPSAGATALALGLLSSSSAEVIAGWDVFSGAGAGDPVEAPVVAAGVTASFVTTVDDTPNAKTWITSDSRGASNDGTWGTSVGPPSPDTTVATGQNLELSNASFGGTITITITNGSDSDIDLDAFHFDANAFRAKAARSYELSVLAGGAITEGIVYTSGFQEITVGGPNNDAHLDIDHDLSGLADSTLEVGGTVEFLLAVFDGADDNSGGHDLWIDNIAVTSSADDADRLAFTVVPPSATAGTDFSVTIEAQDGSGTALVGGVSQDTEILLTASGEEGSVGVLSGNTATILAGENEVILPAVQYTVAEDITLTASQVSGDLLSPSSESTTITINAGPASVLSVEFSSDPEVNDPVGNQSFRINDPVDTLDVFAVSRDSVGNFIGFETGATFALVDVTGDMMDSDLTDNGDGSATFSAAALGTGTIRASVGGLPDGDSGLITVEEPQFRWVAQAGSFGPGASWLDGISPYPAEPPAEPRDLDLFFRDEYATPTQIHLGGDRIARSLNFIEFLDPVGSQNTGLGIRFRTSNGPTGNSSDLTLDTDLEAPAEINVALGAEANINLGNVNDAFIPDNSDNYGDLVLADPLLITHLGTGNLIFSRPISETGGPMSVTIDEASTGTVVFGGANTYTGPTTVNGGILRLTGESIADNATLVVNGGIVDVAADERMVGLTLGDVAQPDGVYGSSESAAPVPDDANFTGPGTITVGPAPLPSAGIVITDISFTDEEEITITFTSEDNVDVYVSDVDDGFDWFLDLEDIEPGTYSYPFATNPKTFFILVTTGEPGPNSTN